jgi:peptide/nickel transport system substrate-binding protein
MIHNRDEPDGVVVDEAGSASPGGMTRQHFLIKGAGGVVGLTSLSALVAACGGNSTTDTGAPATGKPPSKPVGSVSLALVGAPPSLDPTRSYSLNDLPVTSNIYESLLAYDGELRPSLATSWSSNEDATKWTFDLRRGVKFHDGTPFDANAVKASVDYHARRESYVPFLVGPPTKIDTSDPSQVVLTFKEPFPEFGRYMSVVKIISPTLLEGPAAAVAKRVNATPTGTGPYRFVRRQNNDVVAAAFDEHWGTGPYFAEATFKVIPDPSTRVSALEAGDVNIVNQIPPPTAAGLEGRPGISLASLPTLTTFQMSLATARPPFNDRRVRQALMYAIDRQAILDSVFLGKGVISGSPLPPAAYGFVKPATQYGHDPEKAKSLLKAAGHTGPVHFTMVVFDSVLLGSQMGQAIAAMANDAGFSVKCDVVDQGVGDKDIVKGNKRRYDAFILDNGFPAGSALHVNNITFYSQYEGKELLGQIAKMNSVGDGPERLRALAEVQETWARELPVLPLWTQEFIDGYDSSIAGYKPPLDGFQPQLGPAYRPVSA